MAKVQSLFYKPLTLRHFFNLVYKKAPTCLTTRWGNNSNNYLTKKASAAKLRIKNDSKPGFGGFKSI